ncbi:bifunctional [glutamine synthetase] adenylyltransferase/[glutamine synthetase]-adenylyl-L-tyrosine phosphorylase [Sphingomonas montanisoli]|uniref:Bifunctional [glutamine synthetase] adenylyltransferase/[glutamine synthetase]-adenylyl-L-tyrosine phosphorylase n=1 Tax=Sphingomonas montanisoli TaxID=2606412 RepID=A0A5D9C7K8_9SPHN|nr:bifunctional [glutamine synthetase] adenylyltransferase/[glutamine synthetase]-adenylyl-L-tyrosine phosphorylase [Sphingomonas montanisoli]TZG27744.1 bifunctional [glutamine synthetase] adenylyltransferase/[glutamine synthetase]-adenylyl-L-tyrosine phosphorylase [Sphingomonas montanisoli]
MGTGSSSAALDALLERIDRHSPFLRVIARQRPEIAEAILRDGADAVVRAQCASVDPADAARMLRRQRQAVALTVALADLGGAPLEQVVGWLSDFADHALDSAIKVAIAERTPDADPVGFVALALGKHGSRELNYSSDIDPILIFDPETLPRREREEPIEAAVRIAKRVVELLQARDGDGYVFRVDLRLRPSPEATPLALPYEAALGHYESAALSWERAAFIRARAAAGDVALGQSFLDAIRPFVWRRSLDFGAIAEIRAMSHRIRDHHAQGQRFGLGYDLKRGRGGIREVEFYAQIHQLIHGGRDPGLRAPATLDALAALGAAGVIGADEARELADAYRLYRTIEHRIQMVDDQQTHRLPKQADALDNVAALDGLVDGDALIERLRPHVDRVGTLYDALDGEPAARLPSTAEQLDEALSAAGFADPSTARRRIDQLREGKARALRTPVAQAALEAMLPKLVEAVGHSPDPDRAFARFDDLVGGLPSALNLFRLLEARPALAALLIAVLGHAPTLAQALARRPALLDGLIDATAFDPAPSTEVLAGEFCGVERGDGFEGLLDHVRQLVGERRFALGVQLIEGVGDPIDIGGGYARVAEAALQVIASATVTEFERVHGRVPGAELVVLALGRLGGGALTHASDLDLVYLFTGDIMPESDGPKPLGATTYFNRLASRVSAALSVPTASGPLYEVDTRLRPSGAQGLLAVSVDSFARYQREGAWTWEHMALTRARPIFGSDAARAEVAAIVDDTLRGDRDVEELRSDAVRMRAEMARHKPPAGPFDVKLIPGGLVDAEFTVHLLQLRYHVGLDPRLRTAARALADAGLLDPGFADAHALLTRMLVTLRLVAPDSGEPPVASRALVAKACGHGDWGALTAAYGAARTLIAGEWTRVSAEQVTAA